VLGLTLDEIEELTLTLGLSLMLVLGLTLEDADELTLSLGLDENDEPNTTSTGPTIGAYRSDRNCDRNGTPDEPAYGAGSGLGDDETLDDADELTDVLGLTDEDTDELTETLGDDDTDEEALLIISRTAK
jgi:hypothetical protein